MKLFIAAVLLAGCSREAVEDFLQTPEERCTMAREILADTPEPDAFDLSLAVAACAEARLAGHG